MKYNTLGNTGLIVSKLSLGAMTFGNDPSTPAIYKVRQEKAREMVDRALDAGINFFDTADGYAGGQSEQILGKLLAARRRDVIISTKVGFRTGEAVTQAGLSKKHILDSCEQSLKRLGTDYIDLYIAHKEDPFTSLEETLDAFNTLVMSGKVRYIGFSNWSAWKSALAFQMQKDNGWARFSSGQLNYTLVGRDVEQDLVPFMQYAGIGMTVWGPLAGGFLSGKYTRENLKDNQNRLSGFDLLPFDKEAGFRLVDAMRDLSLSKKISIAQIAIAWLLSRSVVSSIILGATTMSQLEDNLAAIHVELNEDDLKTLEALTSPQKLYPHWFNQQMTDPRLQAIFSEK